MAEEGDAPYFLYVPMFPWRKEKEEELK